MELPLTDSVAPEQNEQPQTQQQTPTPQTGSTAPEKPWIDGVSDPAVKEWAGKVGLKTPEDAAKKAYNLEKLFGHEKAGRTVVLPKDDDPKGQAEFFAKLGRPEKPEDYGFQGNPEIVNEYAKVMHATGITKKQADALAAANNEIELAHVRRLEQRSASDMAELQKEWGASFKANLDLAIRAVRDTGLTKEDVQAIETHLGPRKTALMFAKWGEKTKEHGIVTGNSDSFTMTPQQATDKIAALKSDKEWVAKYLEGDKSKNLEMAQLLKFSQGG
jgi:hypothetical protein